MNVLLLGADGFIGRHLVEALSEAGHRLHRGVRVSSSASGSGEVSIDYRHDLTVSAWLPRLAGIEVVINSVGLLRETAEARLDAVHVQAPRALFEACAESGVQKLIQISALGADERAASAYHLSKKAADDHLATLDLDWIIVQPAIVYGPDGASSRFFRLLASLPVLFLPGSGEQWIQPIHIDDLSEAIVRLWLVDSFLNEGGFESKS
jgi:nucleoside-diphosphate-sugar epimerase